MADGIARPDRPAGAGTIAAVPATIGEALGGGVRGIVADGVTRTVSLVTVDLAARRVAGGVRNCAFASWSLGAEQAATATNPSNATDRRNPMDPGIVTDLCDELNQRFRQAAKAHPRSR
jgi:hypothetical protein